MGIPTYTRWLCRKYPLILKQLPPSDSNTSSTTNEDDNGKKRNKPSYVFDNFYIDMNGILHDCAHGQTLGTIPRNSSDVFENLQK